jgi:hypothetical protein
LVALPALGFLLFAAEGFFRMPNAKWAVVLLAVTGVASAAAWTLTRPAAGVVLDAVDAHSGRIGFGLLVVTAAGLVVVSVVQDWQFAFGPYPEDLAYSGQIFWNTLNGNFLAGNVQQHRLYNPPVSSDLALHVSPMMMMTLLPLYALVSSPLVLQIVRDVVLVAAAWPLFLLARERMGGTVGLSAMVLYLFNPAVLAQGFGSFTLLHLVPLPLFWAFHAFVRERFGHFMVWTLIALGVREDVGITAVGFGVWALLARRPARWWLFGLAVPAAWWAAVTLVVMPMFGRAANSALDVALAGGSNNPLGAYGLLLGDPSWVLQGLRDGGLYYLYRLLRSVGFVALLGVEGLFALPSLASTLFLGRVYHGGTDPFSRFALLGSCALVAASVLIVVRLARGHRERRVLALCLLLLLPAASLVDGVKDAVQERFLLNFQGADPAALREAIAVIPPTAAVAAPTYVLPALANRRMLFTVQYLHTYPASEVEYFLLDTDLDRVSRNPELRRRYVALVAELERPGRAERVWRGGEFLVLRVPGRYRTMAPTILAQGGASIAPELP